MKKSTMQLTVDRILRALHPFKIERRRKILTIVDNYLDADLEETDDDEDGESEFDDTILSPAERKEREAIEDREEREVG